MHKVASVVSERTSVPLIHIVDATGAELARRGSKRPLLLATRYVMEDVFFTERLTSRFSVEALVPNAEDRAALQGIIFQELVRGIVSPRSKDRCLDIIAKARSQGCDGVILGCTELGMLLSQSDMPEPALDTAVIHAKAAVDFALSDMSL
jgi:aspartate racemase